MRVDLALYKSSEKLIQPVVDDEAFNINPEYVDGFMEYTIRNVQSGYRRFSLARVSKSYTCDEIEKDVQSDLTVTFNCNREK